MNKPKNREIEIKDYAFNIRCLVSTDIKELKRIERTQSKSIRNQHLDSRFSEQIVSDLRDRRQIKIGAFDLDGNLRSTYGIYFWSSLPYVTDHSVLIDRSVNYIFNPLKTGLLHCVKFIYEYCESINIYQHYSVRHAKHLKTETDIWEEKNEIIHNRYERYDEWFVPSNTLPDWKIYQEIMNHETLPYDSFIRSVRLKQEYRNK